MDHYFQTASGDVATQLGLHMGSVLRVFEVWTCQGNQDQRGICGVQAGTNAMGNTGSGITPSLTGMSACRSITRQLERVFAPFLLHDVGWVKHSPAILSLKVDCLYGFPKKGFRHFQTVSDPETG